MVPPSPYISPEMEKKYKNYTVISLNGKILGIGKDAIKAVEKAKEKMPDVEDYAFLISRIYGDVIRV